LGLHTVGVALTHSSKGDVLAQRERGKEKGHGVFLTTPGSCDDG
jgi:hypothetical protein